MRTKSQVETPGVAGGAAAVPAGGPPVTGFPSGILDSSSAAAEGGIPAAAEGGIPAAAEGGIPAAAEGGIPAAAEGGIPAAACPGALPAGDVLV